MKSFFQSCNSRQRQALLALEQYRGNSLQNANPYEPRFADTPAGKGARAFLESKFPVEAAEMQQMLEGFAPSLQSVMYDLGETSLTKEIHEEKMRTDPVYLQQKKADAEDWEKKMLQQMDSEAEKMAESRGVDLNSKIGLANFDPRFSKYHNQLLQDQLLDEKIARENQGR